MLENQSFNIFLINTLDPIFFHKPLIKVFCTIRLWFMFVLLGDKNLIKAIF